jgi:hypothetical protein
MSTEQAVATATDAQGKPGTEEAGAQDGLDAALKEFDTATTQAETRTETTQTDTPKPEITQDDVAFVRAERAQRQREAFDRDISEAVKTLKGDLEVDDELAEGWLYAKAEKDARLRAAFAQRGQKPDAWKAVLKSLGNDFAKKFDNQTDRAATEDRDAVRLAVRGASTRPPESPPVDVKALNAMSDAEFARHKREKYGVS